MSKRFIVLLASETESQTKAFANYLKDKAGWWHWLPNSWLLVNSSGDLKTSEIRDALGKIYPDVHNIVIELRGNDFWSGFGPTGDQGMFEWIKTTWTSARPKNDE